MIAFTGASFSINFSNTLRKVENHDNTQDRVPSKRKRYLGTSGEHRISLEPFFHFTLVASQHYNLLVTFFIVLSFHVTEISFQYMFTSFTY